MIQCRKQILAQHSHDTLKLGTLIGLKWSCDLEHPIRVLKFQRSITMLFENLIMISGPTNVLLKKSKWFEACHAQLF